MSAVTDSEGKIYYDEENKAGLSNLITIYSIFSGLTIQEVVNKFSGAGYGDFKKDLANLLAEKLVVIQDKYNSIINSSIIDDALDAGREFTTKIAKEKYEQIRKAVGYGR